MKFPRGGRIGAVRQQFADGLFFDRVRQFRRYFGERLKDESAFNHTRMRNNKIRIADYQIAVKQDIKVKRARRVLECPDAAAAVFNFIAQRQQFMRCQRRFQFKYLVQKPRLAGVTHRFSFKKRRCAQQISAFAEAARAKLKIGLAFADI